MQRLVALVLAGIAWGALAYLFGARAIGSVIWPGILAAPAIGPAVGALTQDLFERTVSWRRWLVALASLYAGGFLFALVLGVYDSVVRFHGTRSVLATLGETQAMVVWGITLTGFILFLWPLTYFTHFVVEWMEHR